MDKLLPCPFCNTELVKRGEWDIYDHARIGCILDDSSITRKNLGEWNTRNTPEGWQLVPIEADDRMRQAFNEQHDLPYNPASEREYRPIHTWEAMLAAAPKWGGE